jgi:hypothetical protein
MNERRTQRSRGNVFGAASAALIALSCSASEPATTRESVGESAQGIVLPPVAPEPPTTAWPVEPSAPPPPPGACADGSVEQVFAGGIVGCAGAVTYPNRDSLCGAGYHPLAAMTWRTSRGPTLPTHHYWTDDVLNYSGTGSGMCSAEYASRASACPANEPMRVCASTPVDPEGNRCNWFNCSFDSGSTTPNEYFGGCEGNTTAGTLCVPDSGCADGSVEQTFTRGMVGCAGSVTLANASTLCTAGYVLGYDTDWLRYRNGAAPTHNYWTATPPQYYSGSSLACVATHSASSACPANSPMRICVSDGLDPEGNRCNWSNCDHASGYSTAANEYFGGCVGNTTAGALCVPYKMCADGTMEQQWNRHVIGCAGSVGWGNRESLCGPRQFALSASLWTSTKGSLIPTHNYWTNDHLRWAGTGSNACRASTTSGTSCGMDNPMHICTSNGVDAEGNQCNWTHCGLNTNSPDQFLGGCGSTAGTVCMTGP